MKLIVVLLGCWMGIASPGVGAADSAAATQLWERIQELRKQPKPRMEYREDGVPVFTRQYHEALTQRSNTLAPLLLEFLESHPHDSRRWIAALQLSSNAPSFTRIDGDFDHPQAHNMVFDREAWEAWSRRFGKALSKLDDPTPSMPDAERIFEFWVGGGSGSAQNDAAAIAEWRRRVDVFHKHFPQSSELRFMEWQYMNWLRKTSPQEVPARLATLAADPNPDVAKWAQGEQARERLREQPIELTLTAVDGRKIDLAALRGKVVLLQFWGMNDSRGIEAMHALNQKYASRGLEMVGVVSKPPEMQYEVPKYLEEWRISWPQHWDQSEGISELERRYGIFQSPFAMLFDRAGLLVVAGGLQSGELEPHIQRLLESADQP